MLKAPVSGWRWELVWAAAAGVAAGEIAIRFPEWLELALGIPAMLVAFGAVLWWRGFTAEDRELFRMKKADIEDLSLPNNKTRRRCAAVASDVAHGGVSGMRGRAVDRMASVPDRKPHPGNRNRR